MTTSSATRRGPLGWLAREVARAPLGAVLVTAAFASALTLMLLDVIFTVLS